MHEICEKGDVDAIQINLEVSTDRDHLRALPLPYSSIPAVPPARHLFCLVFPSFFL
jgi:hypothetical protein